jgi:oligopeptide/dipeptide ABC transporter ATP-binding protein
MQMVFQNPYSSLNPRMSVDDCLSEVLLFHRLASRKEVSDRVAELLTQVGVDPSHRKRYPRAFSGGQRQRIALARALAVQPELLVADEPVSALDVSIQAEIINLFMAMRERLSLSMLFVSHDLSVVELVSDRVLVMYLGRPMEIASVADLYAEPRHPYTRALLEAVPGGTARGHSVAGEIPSPVNPPSGCVFRTRCPFAVDACGQEVPALREVAPGQHVACIREDVTG